MIIIRKDWEELTIISCYINSLMGQGAIQFFLFLV
jgi:hypothetical protein